MKEEEDRLERILLQKIKEDIQIDERMEILLKKEKELQDEVKRMEKINTEPVLSDTAAKQAREGKDELQQKEELVLKEKGQEEKENDMLPIKSIGKEDSKSSTKLTNREKELQVKEEYLKNLEKELLQKEEELRTGIQTGSTLQNQEKKLLERQM